MSNEQDVKSVRLDKWLWAARFFKTRQLAVKAIKNGKILLNRQNTKPASNISKGDFLTISRPPWSTEIAVLSLSDRRGPASVAQTLYQETDESIKRREKMKKSLATQPKIQHDLRKPDKRAVRNLRKFKRGD